MITFIAGHKPDHFSTLEENEERKKMVEQTFRLPFPDSLKVTLSSDSIQRITHLYRFMKEQKISKMEFYIFSDSEDNVNMFEPMNNGICFNTNEYIDFDDKTFRTFKIKTSRLTLDSFCNTITFLFLYNNAWTEECFEYTYSIQKLLE